MGGRLDDSDLSSMGYHIPYVGEVYSRSIITDGRSGVALPVPRKSASLIRQRAVWGSKDRDATHEGMTMKLMNSSLRPHSLRVILIGISAKRTSRRRIHRMAVWKRLMSFACLSTSCVGKRLVQNCERQRLRPTL